MLLHDERHAFYITTPIYYATAKPHLGTLYSTILADVIARWQKISGKQVFLLTGTDEHGQKIARAAQEAGESPKKFVDGFISAYQDLWQLYRIDYNRFIRTTDVYHVHGVQLWLKKLLEAGQIYKSFYHGWYCIHCETFVAEKQATDDSATVVCPSCNRPTSALAEEAYFFRLSAWGDALLDFYQKNPEFVKPRERMNEVISFVKSGLRDLSISRTTVTWGIPFPGDEKHVTYVWADALNNYITAVGYGQQGREEEFTRWWPAAMHVLGKDILRFHAVYWPAFLMASQLPLPKSLLVHGWIKVGSNKMSKSLGNAIDPWHLAQEYGPDAVRYYLMKQMAITQDGEFSIADLESRINDDLVNDLGNLLNRLLSLARRYKVVVCPAASTYDGERSHLRDMSQNVIQEMQLHMEDGLTHMALASAWKFINAINRYFHQQEPWKHAQENRERFLMILNTAAHALRTTATILWPFMPSKMEQIFAALGLVWWSSDSDAIGSLESDLWHHEFVFSQGEMLFQKIEVPAPIPVALPSKDVHEVPMISLDDVQKVELVVGTIVACGSVEESEKLLKLSVDLGDRGIRTVMAGIKKSYQATTLVGRQVIVVANLKPRKIAGYVSEGMLLVTPIHNVGQIVLISPVEHVPNGSRLQ